MVTEWSRTHQPATSTSAAISMPHRPAATTNPSIGDSTLSGRYKMLDSETAIIRIDLIWGSTTSGGSGAWRLSLPWSVPGFRRPLAAYILDSGTDHKLATAICPSPTGGGDTLEVVPEAGLLVDASTPMTWANGDRLSIQGVTEVTA